MISHRTQHSLAQFLSHQEAAVSVVLLGKYGAQHLNLHADMLLMDLIRTLRDLDNRTLLMVIQEIVATQGTLRTKVNPKYVFDERLYDLTQCLILDGYIIDGKRLITADPSIVDGQPVEDDLISALRTCGAPRREQIIAKINDSSAAFRSSPPDYNAALVNARVALETLAADVAQDVHAQLSSPEAYNPAKWGEVVTFLRKAGEITQEEERGLAGVFGFLSPGAHRPVGISEAQMTRLGRSFALNMCWFLLQNRLAHRT
ncbi:hypothetical protein ACXZ1M_05910 [Duganella sp. PWIR1]